MAILFRFLIVLGGLLLLYVLLKGLKGASDSRRPDSFKAASFDSVRKEKDMGELVRDPISGTYIAKKNATSRTVDGTVYYFESEENAIEFLEQRQKSS